MPFLPPNQQRQSTEGKELVMRSTLNNAESKLQEIRYLPSDLLSRSLELSVSWFAT